MLPLQHSLGDGAIQYAPAVIVKTAGARSVGAARSLVNVAAATAAAILVQYLGGHHVFT